MCQTCRSARQLVFCVFVYVCLCIRPVEVSGSLSFLSFYNSRTCTSSKICHRTVVNISPNACWAPGKLWSLSWRKLFIVLAIVNKPFCGVNSTCYTMHQGLYCCYLWLFLSTSSLGEVATHSLGLYGDNPLEVCFLVGQLCLGQVTFGPLPHHPKIHHGDYIEGILNAKMGGTWQTFDGNSRVYFHNVQTRYSMKSSPYIPDMG